MTRLKKWRGRLLRLVLSPGPAVVTGVLLAGVGVFLWLEDAPWESPLTDGAGLVCSATGVALIVAGLSGRRPDWIDPD